MKTLSVLAYLSASLILSLNLPSANAAISADQAEQIISDFGYAYKTNLARAGQKLLVRKEWTNNAFDMSIKHPTANTLVLNVTNGVISNKRMTEDTFRLLVCHELGHFFGGAPKLKSSDWAANEGQSDYYATSKCMKRMISHNEYLIERVKKSALLFGQIMAESNHEDVSKISFDNKDKREVLATDMTHPSAQCRVDTLMAGLNCPISANVEFSSTNADVGACLESSIDARMAAGARPRCWYRPAVVGKVCQSSATIPGQKISLVNFTIKKYKDDMTGELSGYVGLNNPKFSNAQKIRRLHNNTRFESIDGKIEIVDNQLYIDQEQFKALAGKSLLPLSLEKLDLKSVGSDFVLEVKCRDL